MYVDVYMDVILVLPLISESSLALFCLYICRLKVFCEVESETNLVLM